MPKGRGQSVLLAMSGGVDSSVAASLLLDQGYEVCGVTFGLAPSGTAPQPTREAIEAAEVCAHLGIEHRYVDCSERFQTQVVEPFCNDYLEGRTPNPCARCNRTIKFPLLDGMRHEGGFDLMATGHYARIEQGEAPGYNKLLRAKDYGKDQSYFLYGLTQSQLAATLFPLAMLSKDDIRALAAEQNLPTASRPESQDVCFIGADGYAAFIEERLRPAGKDLPEAFSCGPIVDRADHVLGTHRGLIHYTAGQRKGIGVAGPEPFYVFAKDPATNRLIVDDHSRTSVSAIEVGALTSIAPTSLENASGLTVKTHYRQAPLAAEVERIAPDTVLITFDSPQRACAPGQVAVIYQGDELLCGGIITRNL